MKSIRWNIILAALLLAGCGANVPSSGQSNLPFALVTSAPNPSPTPTPFLPVSWTPTSSLLSQPVAVLSEDEGLALPTATPLNPTQTEAPTSDPNFLINTIVPLATIDPNFSNGQETINFLLIGSDKRPGSSFRTDTMVVAILRPDEGQVSLISIPRDLWVSIPGWGESTHQYRLPTWNIC